MWQVCGGTDDNFVVINQKGIDPPSLDLLARAGVSCCLMILIYAFVPLVYYAGMTTCFLGFKVYLTN